MNWALCILQILCISCAGDDGPQSLPPDVCVFPADSIMRTSARLHGSIVPKGDGTVLQQYFMYGTSADETAMTKVGDTFMQHDAANVHLWHADITGLTPATDYYYRLYAGNEHSGVVSDAGHFTTMPNSKPSLTALTILSRGPLSVICSYSIPDDGGSTVTETGCKLRTSDGTITHHPSPATQYPSPPLHQIRIGSLRPKSAYTLTAYAVNAEGESETDAVTFTTDDAIVLAEPGLLPTVLDSATVSYLAQQGHLLSIAGDIHGDDVYALHDVLLESHNPDEAWDINLADATIITGGRSYGYGRFTEANTVSYGMFGGCAIRSVVLPDNAVKIENNAFVDCDRLTDIVISASAVDVTPSDGCYALKNISVSKANNHYASADGVLYNVDVSSVVWFPLGKTGTYTLPPSVTSVGDYAFRGCSIASFSIPEGITHIGQGAFADSKVQDVTLPSTLRTVPTATFQNCRSLTTVHLGAGVELLSDYAFDGCPLADIYLDATIPPVCRTTSFSSYDATLYVPASTIDVYKNHKIWSKFQIKKQ